MKKNPARLFALLKFNHESEFIEALRLLEHEIGTAFYFTKVYSENNKLHKLLAYEKKIKLEDLPVFFAKQKKFRQKSNKLFASITIGCCAPDRVQSAHETDSPFRVCVTKGIYLQNQLFFRDIGYSPITGCEPALALKPALVFFSDLRRLIAE